MKYIDKFIRLFFNKYVTDYSQFSRKELELVLNIVKQARFIPKLKNGPWIEGTYILLVCVILLHIYKYYTEADSFLILKSFTYSILGIIFWRLMFILDKNLRVYRITQQLNK